MAKLFALIPARAGSQRLPGKNVINFNGKPLIEWALIAAKEAKIFSRIIVTSDDERVREIARDYDVSLVRQPQFPQTDAVMSRVVEHAISHFTFPEHIMLLQPTSPLRKAKHIKEAWKLLTQPRHRSYNSLVSVDPAGRVNGAIYLFSANRILLGDPIYDDRSLRYPMGQAESVDIDTAEDLAEANNYLVES